MIGSWFPAVGKGDFGFESVVGEVMFVGEACGESAYRFEKLLSYMV